MTMNKTGVTFIHERATPMAVNDMQRAAEVIGKALRDREERIAKGDPLPSDMDFNKVGWHMAWLVGFDHLIDDRKAIRDFTGKIV